MKQYISELLRQALAELSPEEAPQIIDRSTFETSRPSQREFGDYSSNVAMVLFKLFHQPPAPNPPALAKQLAGLCKKYDHKDTFAKVEAVGGFINFHLTQTYLAHNTLRLTAAIEIEKVGQGSKVVFEYSSPNTNKPLHIGHTRNDLYGAACIRLLKAAGYSVVSCEIINDRGIHIMKSMLMYMKFGNGETPESAKMKPDHFVGKFYEMFAAQAAKSSEVEAELLEQAQDLLRRWERGNEEVRQVWGKMNAWFFEGVKQTYAVEGSFFDEVDYESEIYDKGRDLVLAGVERGIFQQEPDGSVSVDLGDKNLGKKYLLRKDGTTLYITQDMYLWDSRNKRHAPDLAMVTTSAEQAYHFQVLARLFQLLGYPWAVNFKHLPYEHVYLGDSKMSSREGNTISADELLEMVKLKVRKVMADLEKLKGSSEDEQLVTAIAFGAIKYGYLKYEPNTRIYFDPENTIALQGNTGPYLQYAHARIKSILKKAGNFDYTAPKGLDGEAETKLMRTLERYNDSVIAAATEYKPNLLCNYLFELVSVFSNLYGTVPILQGDDEEIKRQRLTVLSATARVLAHGLALLGIEAPEEM
jgi:arginyl-tRNA synthetase